MLLLIISGEKKQQPSFRLSKILVNPPCPFPKNWRSPPPKKILSLLFHFSFFVLFFFFANPCTRATSDEHRSCKPFANTLQACERPQRRRPSRRDGFFRMYKGVASDQPGTRFRSGGKGQKRGEKVVRQLKKNRYRGFFMTGVHFGE